MLVYLSIICVLILQVLEIPHLNYFFLKSDEVSFQIFIFELYILVTNIELKLSNLLNNRTIMITYIYYTLFKVISVLLVFEFRLKIIWSSLSRRTNFWVTLVYSVFLFLVLSNDRGLIWRPWFSFVYYWRMAEKIESFMNHSYYLRIIHEK